MLDSQKHNYIWLYSCVFDYQASAFNFMTSDKLWDPLGPLTDGTEDSICEGNVVVEVHLLQQAVYTKTALFKKSGKFSYHGRHYKTVLNLFRVWV
jgi:hypothetical protein